MSAGSAPGADVYTLKRRRLVFDVRDVWLKADTTYRDADIVYYMNADRPVGDEREEYWTILNELTASEDALLAGFERSTRYQIRLAERKDDFRYDFFAGPDAATLAAFFRDYDEMAALKRIRPIERARVLAFNQHGLLVLSRTSDASLAPLVWHAYRCNRERVVLIFTVSTWFRSTDPEAKSRVGRANRYAHWQDMRRFKEQGVRWYDLGGWYHKADDEEKLRINRFKEGFGGQPARNYLCVAYPTWKGKAVKLFKDVKRRLRRMSDVDPGGINRGVWERPRVVEFYRALELRPRGEEAILAKLASWLDGKRILDIGVGGGRTTRRLLELSSDYTGIDYSAAFAVRAQRAFPGVRILRCDARDLSPFQDGSFDFVMFSLNGIDYVGHADRLRILKEVRRVLRDGGYFSFSSHNRGHRHFGKLPWAEGVPASWNDVKTCLRVALFLPRHWRMRRHEVHERDYSIVNDIAHDFTLMTYYMPVDSQVAQLTGQGFAEIEAYDLEGQPVDGESTHAWIFYLARKPGA